MAGSGTIIVTLVGRIAFPIDASSRTMPRRGRLSEIFAVVVAAPLPFNCNTRRSPDMGGAELKWPLRKTA